MLNETQRIELLDALERKLRAWISNPSWSSFQPVSKVLKQLDSVGQLEGAPSAD